MATLHVRGLPDERYARIQRLMTVSGVPGHGYAILIETRASLIVRGAYAEGDHLNS
jgi:hypothetical protein